MSAAAPQQDLATILEPMLRPYVRRATASTQRANASNNADPRRRLHSRRRLVVGMSLDANSDPALRRAAGLSHDLDTSIDALHVADWPDEPAERERAAPALLSILKARLAPVLADTDTLRLEIREGETADEIVAHADVNDAGMILLGPHQRRGLMDRGGLTSEVLARARCPVWCEPEGDAGPRAIESLLVPVRLTGGGRAAARWASEFARAVGARLVLLLSLPLTNQPGEDDKAEFERLAASLRRRSGVEVETCYDVERIVDAVRHRSHEHDLIVVPSKGRQPLAAAVMGSAAQAVLQHAEVPVAVIPSARGRTRAYTGR